MASPYPDSISSYQELSARVRRFKAGTRVAVGRVKRDDTAPPVGAHEQTQRRSRA